MSCGVASFSAVAWQPSTVGAFYFEPLAPELSTFKESCGGQCALKESWQQPQHARVHSSVVRAADCRSAGPWFKSGCALFNYTFFSRAVSLTLWSWVGAPRWVFVPMLSKWRMSKTDDMDEFLISFFSIEKVTRSHCLQYYGVRCLQFPSESDRNRITSFANIIKGPIISLTAGVSRAGART